MCNLRYGLLAFIVLCSAAFGQNDSGNWTILQPSPDSVVMHVSSSGSDANDGLTPESAKQTVKAAIAALGKRKGNPDWIKLERGSVFTEGRIGFSLSGRSQSEPFVITSYGEGSRPVLKDTEFFYWWPNASPDSSLDFVAFTALDFEGTGANRGLLLAGRVNNILIEDCRFRGLSVGAYFQWHKMHPKAPEMDVPWLSAITIRRNAFIECTGLCGLNIDNSDGAVIEENVFDLCGHPNPTVKKHNVYLKHARNLTVRRNYFLRGSNMGLKCSSDTIDGFTRFRVDNNYFYNNGFSMDHSLGISWDPVTAASHANGIVSHNVFHESARTFGTTRQDLAMWLLNSRDITYQQNYFIHKQIWNGNQMIAWGESQQGITFKDNLVHNWKMPASRPESDLFVGRWAQAVTNGTMGNNTIVKDASLYQDPNRTLFTWLQVPDINAASAVLRESHTREAWDASKTADKAVGYVIDGFRLAIPDIEPDPNIDTVIAVRESEIRALIIAVEGVLALLKTIAGKN